MDEKLLRRISYLAKEASLIEVNAPKPGNITPEHDFEDTTYEDFIKGCDALQACVYEAAKKGYEAKTGQMLFSRIGLGKWIKKGVEEVRDSHSGGNTHLGIIILYVPIASAMGMCVAEGRFSLKELRKNIKKVIRLSSPDDSAHLYEAIASSGMGGLGSSENFDVNIDESKKQLIQKRINLQELMELSSEKDSLAKELASGYEKIFGPGLNSLEKIRKQTQNLNWAIVQTYLILLSNNPDTLIERKMGKETAQEVSKRAEDILNKGGMLTKEGKKAIQEFDQYLRSKGNKLNPGTTADLISAVLFVSLLNHSFEHENLSESDKLEDI